MNIPVAHTMGGEISGTIDESIRHAVTKLAHIHFPANARAAERIVRMGEHPDTVHAVGCPRIDLGRRDRRAATDTSTPPTGSTAKASAPTSTSTQPFLLVSQHPVTTEYGEGEQQIKETLVALDELRMPTIMLWPNADAGSEDIASGMRKFREQRQPEYIRFYKNFPIETYVRLMNSCACAVGNSSAPMREGAFIGVPTVNVGTPAVRPRSWPQRRRRRPRPRADRRGGQAADRARPISVGPSVRRWRCGGADCRRAGDHAAARAETAALLTLSRP